MWTHGPCNFHQTVMRRTELYMRPRHFLKPWKLATCLFAGVWNIIFQLHYHAWTTLCETLCMLPKTAQTRIYVWPYWPSEFLCTQPAWRICSTSRPLTSSTIAVSWLRMFNVVMVGKDITSSLYLHCPEHGVDYSIKQKHLTSQHLRDSQHSNVACSISAIEIWVSEGIHTYAFSNFEIAKIYWTTTPFERYQ